MLQNHLGHRTTDSASACESAKVPAAAHTSIIGIQSASSPRPAGFAGAILRVHANSLRARRFYELGGWCPDSAEKPVESFDIPVLEVRYRTRLK